MATLRDIEMMIKDYLHQKKSTNELDDANQNILDILDREAHLRITIIQGETP
jgi:hypothetical protein